MPPLTPSQVLWHDGELVPWDEARVHVGTHVLHYGSSVFEGIRCYKTERGPAVFRLPEHSRRLIDSAKIYRMDLSYDVEQLNEAVLSTIRANEMDHCYIRPLVFRGFHSLGVNPLNCPVETWVMVWEWGAYLGDDAIENGVDVKIASWNRLAHNTMPSLAKAGGNYMNAALIKMEAIKDGYAEAIALGSDGTVSEGSGENLFVIRNGVIFTPPVASAILAGITRDSVMRIARDLGYEVREQVLPRELLYIADEVFFTGTAVEVTPVRSIDRIPVGEGTRGPITEQLQRHFFDIVNGRSEDVYGWLTPVYEDTEAADAATLAEGHSHA